jgi:hypothetical protein
MHVNVHNNAVTLNSSIGDELFSATPAGAGGVSFCTGADYYKFNYNWVCGNMSTGDGGGVVHMGSSTTATSSTTRSCSTRAPTRPSRPTAAASSSWAPPMVDPGPRMRPPRPTRIARGPGLSDGTGPGLVINANLIMGNAAESGSGGGLRFQDVNGTEVSTSQQLRVTGTRSASPTTSSPTTWPAGTALECRCRTR